MNSVIHLTPAAVPEGFDYAAYNRRAEERFRLMRMRVRILTAADACVTLMIGIGFLTCIGLVLTML